MSMVGFVEGQSEYTAKLCTGCVIWWEVVSDGVPLAAIRTFSSLSLITAILILQRKVRVAEDGVINNNQIAESVSVHQRI